VVYSVHIYGCLLSASSSTYSPLIHLAPPLASSHSSCNILILASLIKIYHLFSSQFSDRPRKFGFTISHWEAKLYDDEKSMTCEFASLVTATCHSVQDKVPTVIFCVPTIYSVSILSLKAYEPALRSITSWWTIKVAKSIAEIFAIWSPNQEILKYIIKGHDTSDDLKK